MKKITFCQIAFLLSKHLYSQTPLPNLQDGIVFHISLIGAIKYRGLGVGADYMLIKKNIDKEKINGVHKLITKNRYITTNLGFYYHKSYNTNVFFHIGYLMQRVNKNGWQRSFEPKIGISRTFINAPVYKIDDGGNVKRVKAAGDFYFAPALSFGFGKAFSVNNSNSNVALFTKATLFLNYPYNNFLYGRGMIEAGATYKLQNLLTHKIKVKNKIK